MLLRPLAHTWVNYLDTWALRFKRKAPLYSPSKWVGSRAPQLRPSNSRSRKVASLAFITIIPRGIVPSTFWEVPTLIAISGIISSNTNKIATTCFSKDQKGSRRAFTAESSTRVRSTLSYRVICSNIWPRKNSRTTWDFVMFFHTWTR